MLFSAEQFFQFTLNFKRTSNATDPPIYAFYISATEAENTFNTVLTSKRVVLDISSITLTISKFQVISRELKVNINFSNFQIRLFAYSRVSTSPESHFITFTTSANYTSLTKSIKPTHDLALDYLVIIENTSKFFLSQVTSISPREHEVQVLLLQTVSSRIIIFSYAAFTSKKYQVHDNNQDLASHYRTTYIVKKKSTIIVKRAIV